MDTSKPTYQSFSELSTSETLLKGKFEEFVKEVLIVLARELEVSRVSFWLFKATKEAFENLYQYDALEESFEKENAIRKNDFPVLYEYMVNSHAIKSDIVDQDERLSELVEDYYNPGNIRSMIGRQVWYNGVLFGYLIVEQRDKVRTWISGEEIHLHIALSYIIQSYNSKQWLARYHPEKMSDGDLSEFVDKEKEEMRRKLTDHAFYASHNIRHPITTIMALVDLVKANWEDRENYEMLLTQLKIETMNLDESIRVMSAKIELD